MSLMGIPSTLILTVIMFYRSTTHALSVSECIRACDNTISNDFKQKCNSCVGSVELSAQMCIKACGNTAFDQYRAICSRCTGRPPINFDMCSHACSNTINSEFRHICDQCVGRVETSEDMCWKACRNIAHDQFRRICSRCPKKYRGVCGNGVRGPSDVNVTDKSSSSWHDMASTHNSEYETAANSHVSAGAIIGLSVCIVVAMVIGGVCGGYCRYCRPKRHTAEAAHGVSMASSIHLQYRHNTQELDIRIPPPYTETVDPEQFITQTH